MSRMRAAPRADDADVASLVGRFRAKGEEESRRRDAFDKEWDQRVLSFRKRCDAVERKLRDRHAAALEKTRASLEARLVSKPKRYTPQLEELLRKRKELMRLRQFSEALDALKQAEAREKVELEDHKRRVRGENVEILDALFRTQRDELAVFARERDAEETRISAARANAAARAAKNGFRDYEARGVAGDERDSGSDDDDDDDDDPNAAALRGAHRVSRVPSIRRRGMASTGGAPASTARAHAHTENVPRFSPGDERDARRPSPPPPPSSCKEDDVPEPHLNSAPASPAALSRFYCDVGGVADVMRLDTADNGVENGERVSRPASSHSTRRWTSHDSTRRHSTTQHGAAVDGFGFGPDVFPPSRASGFVPPGSPIGSTAARVASTVQPYAGAYAVDPRVDDAAYGFMVSDAQRNALAELHARRDAALRLWEAEERALVTSSAGWMPIPNGDARVPSTLNRTGARLFSTSARARVSRPPTTSRNVADDKNKNENENENENASKKVGLSGAEARAAADDLVAAAMRMTAGAERARPEPTAKRRAREEAAAAAEARAERRRELKGDDRSSVTARGPAGVAGLSLGYLSDDDSSVDSEELDDLYLSTPPGARRGEKDVPKPGATVYADTDDPLTLGGVRLALGSLAGAFKAEPGPVVPRGGGRVVGGLGSSAAPRVLPGVDVMTHRARGGESASSYGQTVATRGPAAPRVADDAADPRRDFPAGDVARGAALLRRMPGPDDCYRSRRLGADADAGVGELGFPRRDDRIASRSPANEASPAKGEEKDERLDAAGSVEHDDTTRLLVSSVSSVSDSAKTERLGVLDESREPSPPRLRGLGALRRREEKESRGGGLKDAAASAEDEERLKAHTEDEERQRSVSAAVAAARLASFKYGAAVAPAVGAFGQPIQTRPALRRGDDKTVRGERNKNENENNASARSPPRRRVAPLGHNVDPVTLLKLADAELTRAVERDGLSRGEVLVSLKPNADATNAKAETDHARNAIAFSDPTALPAPPTKEDLDLLFKFCRKGEYELCRDLFKKRGIDPNTRDAHGNTPLIVACQNGAGRVAKLCLRRGADVNVYNAKRNTALHFAATFGFEKLASWLVENGADKHAVNDNGKKPFDEGL